MLEKALITMNFRNLFCPLIKCRLNNWDTVCLSQAESDLFEPEILLILLEN